MSASFDTFIIIKAPVKTNEKMYKSFIYYSFGNVCQYDKSLEIVAVGCSSMEI